MRSYKTLALTILLLGVFLWSLPLQTQDGPNHKQVTTVLSRLADSSIEQNVYQSQLSLTRTNMLFAGLYQPLKHIVSIDHYEKIFWVFFVLLIPITYRFFLAVWYPANTWLWVLSLPICFHPLFIRGFHNFLASVPLTLMALALLRLGLMRRAWFYWILFVLCCGVAFWAHPFPFIVLPLCLLLLAFDAGRDRLPLVGLYALPVAVFLVAGFVVPFIGSLSGGQSATPYTFYSLHEHLAGLFFNNYAAFNTGQLLLYLPFFAVLITLLFWSARSVAWRYKVYWVALLTAYFLFPDEGNGGAHLNQRFLPFIWFFAPLGLEFPARRAMVVKSISLATALVAAGITYSGMWQIDRIVADAKSVLKNLPSESRLYPMNFDPKGPALTYSSLMHLWANYEPIKVVFSPSLFAHFKLMPLGRKYKSSLRYFPATTENFPERYAQDRICRRRDLVETLDKQSCRKKAARDILSRAATYDYWFVYRAPESFRELMRSVTGLKLVAKQGDASLWHNQQALPFDPPLL